MVINRIYLLIEIIKIDFNNKFLINEIKKMINYEYILILRLIKYCIKLREVKFKINKEKNVILILVEIKNWLIVNKY